MEGGGGDGPRTALYLNTGTAQAPHTALRYGSLRPWNNIKKTPKPQYFGGAEFGCRVITLQDESQGRAGTVPPATAEDSCTMGCGVRDEPPGRQRGSVRSRGVPPRRRGSGRRGLAGRARAQSGGAGPTRQPAAPRGPGRWHGETGKSISPPSPPVLKHCEIFCYSKYDFNESCDL